MRAENVQALRERLLPDVREHERLAMGERPHLVACRECAPIADRLVERAVAALLGQRDGGGCALAFRLVVRDEVDVLGRQLLERLKIGLVVLLPCHVAFHMLVPFVPAALGRRPLRRSNSIIHNQLEHASH